MNIISYEEFLDKVRGCFLGKTVIGTLGAPYEGVKMPMELKFRPEMVDTMLPNDDLDLQVIWLDVVEKYGPKFTSRQLLDRFVNSCSYSPGEYAIMRKNFMKGIYPPYSGEFCNDFYREGNGCPIRSEIWACLAPGNKELAADYSSRDGILDHKGESVLEERFFAAMEAEAFFEKDIYKLIKSGLKVIPKNCKTRRLVNDVLRFAKESNDIKTCLARLLFNYGHNDCTNSLQNMGITLLSLIFGEGDMIKTGMLALNCGFDTDCTCASAGALLGIIIGQKELEAKYGWKDIKFVLGVDIKRRSDKVDDLAEDIARLGAFIGNDKTMITDVPDITYDFVSEDVDFEVIYKDGTPSMGLENGCNIKVIIKNTDGSTPKVTSAILTPPEDVAIIEDRRGYIDYNGQTVYAIDAYVCVDMIPGVIHCKNIITLCAKVNDTEKKFEFGVSGNKCWKLTGPLWKTSPATDENVLGEKIGYWQVFPAFKSEADMNNVVRHFHLNFETDTKHPEIPMDELFKPLPEENFTTGTVSDDLIAKPYLETYVETSEDAFNLSDFMGFKGPCVCYLSQILIAPSDMTVCVQLGCSSPVRLYINDELIAESERFDTWNSENVHMDKVHLNKGENRIVLRMTRGNADAKFSLIFSETCTCSTHYFDFITKKI